MSPDVFLGFPLASKSGGVINFCGSPVGFAGPRRKVNGAWSRGPGIRKFSRWRREFGATAGEWRRLFY